MSSDMRPESHWTQGQRVIVLDAMSKGHWTLGQKVIGHEAKKSLVMISKVICHEARSHYHEASVIGQAAKKSFAKRPEGHWPRELKVIDQGGKNLCTRERYSHGPRKSGHWALR